MKSKLFLSLFLVTTISSINATFYSKFTNQALSSIATGASSAINGAKTASTLIKTMPAVLYTGTPLSRSILIGTPIILACGSIAAYKKLHSNPKIEPIIEQPIIEQRKLSYSQKAKAMMYQGYEFTKNKSKYSYYLAISNPKTTVGIIGGAIVLGYLVYKSKNIIFGKSNKTTSAVKSVAKPVVEIAKIINPITTNTIVEETKVVATPVKKIIKAKPSKIRSN